MKKFLVIQTAFIGDAILSSAVLELLHKEFPDARIDVMVRAGNQSLFDRHPFIRNVYAWDKKNGKYRNLLRLIRAIRAAHYDGVINLQRHTASALVTMFSGAQKTAGFDSSFLSMFFSYRIRHQVGKKNDSHFTHEVDRYVQLVNPWVVAEKVRPVLYPSADDVAAIVDLAKKPFVTISPSSVWFTKQTPPEVWEQLIDATTNKQIYLLGGPADKAMCDALAHNQSHVEVLAGKLSLLQSAALMQRASMNYTNDSAPLHLCSAVNAPVTAVFCSTIPEFGFGPLSDRARVVQSRLDLDCKPCGIHGKSSCPKGHFNCGKIAVADLLQGED